MLYAALLCTLAQGTPLFRIARVRTVSPSPNRHPMCNPPPPPHPSARPTCAPPPNVYSPVVCGAGLHVPGRPALRPRRPGVPPGACASGPRATAARGRSRPAASGGGDVVCVAEYAVVPVATKVCPGAPDPGLGLGGARLCFCHQRLTGLLGFGLPVEAALRPLVGPKGIPIPQHRPQPRFQPPVTPPPPTAFTVPPYALCPCSAIVPISPLLSSKCPPPAPSVPLPCGVFFEVAAPVVHKLLCIFGVQFQILHFFDQRL